MSQISLRSRTDSFKMADNNEKCSALLKDCNRKRKTFTTLEKSLARYELDNINSSAIKPHITDVSIVCSVPLHKISGFLEKIGASKSLKKDPTYKYMIKSLKDNDKIKNTPFVKTLCLYCDKKFSSQIIQNKHIEKIHTLSKNRRFSSRHSNAEGLESKLHIVQSFSSRQRNFSGCNFCKNTKENIVASANGLMGLFFHFIDFHSDKYFACKLCILRFQNQEKWKNHSQSVHKNFTFLIDENFKSKDRTLSKIINDSEKLKLSSSNAHKTLSIQRSTLSKTQNVSICNTNCSNGIKNSVFSGDEPILSRLGVAQNRLPGNRKSLRLRRDEVIKDMLLKSDHNTNRSRTRSRVGKSLASGEYSDVVFRIPTKNDNMSCIFEDNFYEKVVSNVQNNILYFLDGKIVGNTSEPHSNDTVSQSLHLFRSTLLQYPVALNSEIHTATLIRPSTTFPTLLTAEQYGADVTAKIKRSITKYSWKWKWDSFKKFKLVNEGGKIIKKLKQSTVSLRDLSKLDMWTQLTMREKNYLNKAIMARSNTILSREEKQRLNDQLNCILDTRLLPHIILEQSEQTIIKFEFGEHITLHDDAFQQTSLTLQNNEHNFLSLLNLFPTDLNSFGKKNFTLSGEWARPRCYLCIGCGTKFEKLKSLEEHKMFRHSHVYSMHYEIVGRELMASNLLKRFFIPKRALNRYGSTLCYEKMCFLNKKEADIQNKINILPEEESSDSIQSLLNSVTTIHSSKNSIDGGDTDSKTTINLNEVSPTDSMRSVSTSVSPNALQSVLHKENDAFVCCTKCKRKCSGVLELYRHMLDCSGDYIWNLAKKRKYRYYCGSKKRRQYKKKSNKELRKKKQNSSKESRNFSENNDSSYSKTKTSTRQRPSDADSIKKMLENLPPKRICKKIIPHINKTRKSKLMVKRKKFNSQVLKHKLSKRITQTRSVHKAKIQKYTKSTNSKCKKQDYPRNQDINKHEPKSTQNINSFETNGCSKNIDEKKLNKKKNESRESVEEVTESSPNIMANTEVNTSRQKLISPFNKFKTLEESIISKNNINGNLSETVQSSLSECASSYLAETTIFSAEKILPKNLNDKNLKKRRCKKIHECIAMLTGKLEEKLKTEKTLEFNTKNSGLESKSDSSFLSKTAKRKACSRRIIKLSILNNQEIAPTLNKNLILDNEELQQSFQTNEVPIDIDNNVMPSSKEILKVIPSEANLDFTTKKNNYSANENTISKPLGPPKLICDALISKPSSFPKRRQTICGNEGLNCPLKLYDDIEPLDLSKKSKELTKPKSINNTEISVCHDSQTNKNHPLVISSPILQIRQFYSNLELLKIPQVKNPCHLNSKNDKFPFLEINSKRKGNNQDIVNCFDELEIARIHKLPINTKKTSSNRKQNCSKLKNSQKMNEEVINHIDDAINSVINAEKEFTKQECIYLSNKSYIQKDKTIDLKDFSANKAINLGNESIFKNKCDETHKIQLTPLKRNVRSKTVDCVSFDGENNNFVDNTMFEKQLEGSVKNSLCQDNLEQQLNKTVEKEMSFLCKKTESRKEFMGSNNEKAKIVDFDVSLSAEKFNKIEKDPKLYGSKHIFDKCKLSENTTNDLLKANDLKPKRRRRKNELAAIVADQLLESFKLDNARRENLKKLENLANDNSKDLLLTGMLLMSGTKRNASIPITTHHESSPEKYSEFFKRKKLNQTKKTKCVSRSKEKTKNKGISETINELDRKKKKKTQTGICENSIENEKIIDLKTCFESFKFDSITQKPEMYEKSKLISPSLQIHDCNKEASVTPKQCTILRPSLLSVSLEPGKATVLDSKSIVTSRDPRLNKNIHKDEDVWDFRCSIPKNSLVSLNNSENTTKIIKEICDAEDDNYLKEIANNVNEKIQSSENRDFKFINDEFDVGILTQDDSINIYRPSTSMSVRSAPNLNECNSNFGSTGENTNTELIDMDLDDNLSVYTSFSQEVNRGGRKRRRRSILLSRKPKKKSCRDGEEKFECVLCKKTFYASSSLAKHQTTLAHVSKLSEQEYLLSKKFENQQNQTQTNHQTEVNEYGYEKEEFSLTNKVFFDNPKNNDNENIKNKNNYNLFSRLSLNPDERLFFECCNILKGTQTTKTTDLETSNCTKYTFSYQEKKVSAGLHSTKNHQPSSTLSCININAPDTVVYEITSQNMQQSVHNDQSVLSSQLRSKISEDIRSAVDQNNSVASRLSIVTNTTSRFKTKAAMKGYEDLIGLNTNHDLKLKSGSLCKLTALAEIALGNENSNSQHLVPEPLGIDTTAHNSSISLHKSVNENVKEIEENNTKNKKQSANHLCTTSSKTVMHLSVLKNVADQKDVKEKSDKIVIPDRPFKNIGLEEKETIKFQKPKTSMNLLNPNETSVSSISFSDREFDFESLSCDDEMSVYNSNSKTDKNNCSSRSSSKSTSKTFENKSLIMGRIFKNANCEKKKNAPRKVRGIRKDSLIKTDLNQIFDELRGNSVPKIISIDNDEKKTEIVSEDFDKNEQISTVLMNTRSARKTKNLNEKQKSRKNFCNLKSELGMRTEDIALLINEGQRKSKRRCATNRPKKLVEMWSSDEYEEFLSTKDIFALIEEKEKEEKNKKRKVNNTCADKVSIKEGTEIGNKVNNASTRSIKSKLNSNKKKECNNLFKLDKNKLTGLIPTSNNVEPKISLTKDINKTRHRSKQKDEKCKMVGCESKSKLQNNKEFSEFKAKKKTSKNNKSEKQAQVNISNPRRKRLSSEKLYYWSSSSDEDFGRITGTNAQNLDSGEQFKKHGWIVGDSHKKLVTLLAIAKGNKKVDSCGVKKKNLKKRVK